VKVTWVTALELNSLGFDLYRAESDDLASAVKVTPSTIAARSSSGSAYSFVDTSAKAGVAYRSWLREIEISGAMNWYGPVMVGQSTPVVQQPIANPVAFAPVNVQTVAIAPVAEAPAVAEVQTQVVVQSGVAAVQAPVAAADAPVNVVAPAAAVQTSEASNVVVAASAVEAAPAAIIEAPVVAQPAVAPAASASAARLQGVAVVDGQGTSVKVGAQSPAELTLPQTPGRATVAQQSGGALSTLVLSLLTMLGVSAVAGVGMLRRKRK
jgi:ribonuclease E